MSTGLAWLARAPPGGKAARAGLSTFDLRPLTPPVTFGFLPSTIFPTLCLWRWGTPRSTTS